MGKKEKPKGISRRKFLKNFGTGVVGGSVLIKNLHAAPDNGDKKEKLSLLKNKTAIALKVNGKDIALMIEPRTTLAKLLRDHLKLSGTKVACNQGECGACTVLLDGMAVYSCQMLALDAAGKEVTTIEGLMQGEELHPIQQAFIDHDGFQCGFCTSGQVMTAHALLQKNKNPSRKQIIEGMSGNLCRCGAYPKILESVMAAAEKK